MTITPDTALPWLMRTAWLVLPFAAGPALAAALDPRADAVRATASAGLWLGWTVVVVALLVPHSLGLTGLRLGAPAALAAAIAVAMSGESGAVDATLALTSTTAATALALLPETGTWLINGGAYANERRHLLRPPAALLAGPIFVAWAVLIAALCAGPLLLAAGEAVAGAVTLALGLPLALFLGRALHSLTQRWAVLVPSGLVLKDHFALVDPVLLRRVDIEVLRRAPAGSDALDLTAGAPGPALEVRLVEAVPLVRVVLGTRRSEPGRSAAMRFTPTRPGVVLHEARKRRIRTE